MRRGSFFPFFALERHLASPLVGALLVSLSLFLSSSLLSTHTRQKKKLTKQQQQQRTNNSWIVLWRGTPPPQEALCEEARALSYLSAEPGFDGAASRQLPSRFDGECLFHFESVFKGASLSMAPRQLRLFLEAFSGSVASVHEDLGVRVSPGLPMPTMSGGDGGGGSAGSGKQRRRQQIGLAGRIAEAVSSISSSSSYPVHHPAKEASSSSSSSNQNHANPRRSLSSLSGRPNAAGPGDGDARDLYLQDPSPWPLDRIDQDRIERRPAYRLAHEGHPQRSRRPPCGLEE